MSGSPIWLLSWYDSAHARSFPWRFAAVQAQVRLAERVRRDACPTSSLQLAPSLETDRAAMSVTVRTLGV